MNWVFDLVTLHIWKRRLKKNTSRPAFFNFAKQINARNNNLMYKKHWLSGIIRIKTLNRRNEVVSKDLG